MSKTVIIQGSSRSKGNTHTIANIIKKQIDCDLIDLSTKTIHQYSYDHQHQTDDFLPLMRQIIEYDLIIFATPVYWYSMSGILKAFFDRISDCLQIEKELGRKLRGRQMAAICCGSDKDEIEGYFIPFKKSAEYLGMSYLGDLHTWIEGNEPLEVVVDAVNVFAGRLVLNTVSYE